MHDPLWLAALAAAMALTGLFSGLLAGLLGVGGGIVIVPMLIMLARMAPATATGTSLGALLLPVGALGAFLSNFTPGVTVDLSMYGSTHTYWPASATYASVAERLETLIASALDALAGEGTGEVVFNAGPVAREGVPGLGAASVVEVRGAPATSLEPPRVAH